MKKSRGDKPAKEVAKPGRAALSWHYLHSRFRQWFGPRLGLFILFGCVLGGLSMSMLFLSGFGVRTGRSDSAMNQEFMRVVPWADLRVWMGARLGLSTDEMDRLSLKALGSTPALDRSMTRPQMRQITGWIRGQINDVGEALPEVSGDGFLLMVDLVRKGKSGVAPFRDLPLDHPVYSAWKPLLDLDLGELLADAEGRARPYDAIQWDELLELRRRIELRFAGTSGSTDRGMRAVGEISLPALISALDEISRLSAFQEHKGQDSHTWRPASNSRLEALAALSAMLDQCSEADAIASR